MKILFALVAVITAIVSDGFDIKNDISSKLFEKYSVSCDSYSELHSGDAKFFGENIITSIGGIFTVISGEGDIRKYPDIHTNWVDCVADEGIVIYANFSKQVGMLRFDDEMNLVEHKILMENNHLYIDPAIVKVDHFYYMTFTEIIGNVNNANAADANGEYILHLYKTENFDSLFFVRELADDVHNIEDVELFYDGTELHAVYEYEMVDKSDSAIILQNFDKNGIGLVREYIFLKTWPRLTPMTKAVMVLSIITVITEALHLLIKGRGDHFGGAVLLLVCMLITAGLSTVLLRCYDRLKWQRLSKNSGL